MSSRVLLRALPVVAALALAACGGEMTATSSASDTGASTRAPAAGSGQSRSTPSQGQRAVAAAATGDWPKFGFDAQSSGAGPADSGISAADVGRLKLRTVTIDGVADSAAIELHDVSVHGARHDLVAVTTSYGRAIALDARTGAKLWEFRPAGVDSRPGNPQVTTASPVADPDRRFLYSASPDGVIHKLSVSTGRQVWSRRITFDPVHEKIASSLNVSGRWVVAVTGGYVGDIPPYDGHVVTIDRASGRIAHVWNTECSDRHRLIRASSCGVTNTRGDNAIWGRAGATIEPGSGRILVATGNGPFDGSTSWGDSVLELSPDASRLLHNWTPSNQAALDSGDVDLGSSSPAILGNLHGRRLAIQGGKDGELHLLDLDRLNGTTGGPGRRLGGEVGETASPAHGQVLPQPAVWHSRGHTYVFDATAGGTAGYELVGGAHPRLATMWSDSTGGTSPVIAGGLLYVYNTGGSLAIRRPLSGALLRSLPASPGHWNSPIVTEGRIIEPTGAYGSSATTSTIDIYHLPGR